MSSSGNGINFEFPGSASLKEPSVPYIAFQGSEIRVIAFDETTRIVLLTRNWTSPLRSKWIVVTALLTFGSSVLGRSRDSIVFRYVA